MSDFVPPFPPRLAKPPTPWERVRLGRQNLLAAFEEQAFGYEFMAMKLFAREVFLCNTPESVQFAFSTHNESFERKSPGHRRSLEPLYVGCVFINCAAVTVAATLVVAASDNVPPLLQV